MLGDGHRAEPKRLDVIAREVRVIPVLVPLHLLVLVVGGPVDLDGKPVLGIQVVLVVGFPVELPSCLMA
jgi:hypothetical protein